MQRSQESFEGLPSGRFADLAAQQDARPVVGDMAIGPWLEFAGPGIEGGFQARLVECSLLEGGSAWEIRGQAGWATSRAAQRWKAA